jgi:hypothetical protein
MIRILWLGMIVMIQEEFRYKPKEDFEINFDLSFKQRSFTDEEKIVHLNETRAEHERRTSHHPLPYLVLKIKILKTDITESRVKVIRDDKATVLSKKAEEGMEFKLDVGFTDDVKGQIRGHKHIIHFFGADKKEVSRILIEFDAAGNYMVNGERRGKV